MNSLDYFSEAKDIVFCFNDPILETIDSPDDKVYVLLRAELQFSQNFKNLETLTLESFITPEIYKCAEKKADLEWRALMNTSQLRNLCYYKYDFLNLRFPGIFTELIIENIIKVSNFRTVHIPFHVSESFKCYGEPSRQLADFSDRFNKVVLGNYIRKIGVPYRFYSERMVSTTPNVYRSRPAFVIPLEFLALLWRVIRKCVSILPKFNYQWNGGPFISLCIQVPKNRQLLKQIRSNKIDYRLIDLAYLRNRIESCGNKGSYFELDISATDVGKGPRHVIDIWLIRLCEFHDLAFNIFKETEISALGNFFITDAEHCHLIARISSFFESKDGYSIIIIPEGGTYQHFVSPIIRFELKEHRNLFRGFASKLHESLYAQKINASKATFVCGYKTTAFGARIVAGLLRFYLQLLHSTARKKIIFLDLVPLFSPDIGICRSNARDKSRVLSEVSALTEAVGKQYIIYTNDRAWSDDYELLLQDRVIRLPFHWSILAYAADVTLSRQSSIVFECVSQQIPILVWDPFLDFDNIFLPLLSTVDGIFADRFCVLERLLDEKLAVSQAKNEIDSKSSLALNYEFIFNLFRNRSKPV